MRGLKRAPAACNIHPGFRGAYMEPVKRSRLVWTPELHQRFEEAVDKAGGIDVAVPKTVLEVNIPTYSEHCRCCEYAAATVSYSGFVCVL